MGERSARYAISMNIVALSGPVGHYTYSLMGYVEATVSGPVTFSLAMNSNGNPAEEALFLRKQQSYALGSD